MQRNQSLGLAESLRWAGRNEEGTLLQLQARQNARLMQTKALRPIREVYRVVLARWDVRWSDRWGILGHHQPLSNLSHWPELFREKHEAIARQMVYPEMGTKTTGVPEGQPSLSEVRCSDWRASDGEEASPEWVDGSGLLLWGFLEGTGHW